MPRWPFALVACSIFAVAAQAQDRKAPPEPLTVLLDNERVRVMEMRLKPGGKLSLQGHAYQFVYMLTDGSLVFTPPGKTPFELTLQSGEVSLLPSQSTSTENDGDKEVRAVVVEIKETPHTGSSGKGRVAHGKKPPKK